jgi:hypothetical protein
MTNAVFLIPQTPIDPDVESAQQLHLGFQRVHSKVDAHPVAGLLPISLDVGGVVQTVLGAVPAVLTLRTSIVALGSFDPQDLDNLRDYALALGHIHGRYRFAKGTPSTTLVKELVATRERFHADAQPLVIRGRLDATRVAALKNGNSQQALAYDVIGLAELFLERLGEFGSGVLFTQDELQHARLQGNRLLTALGTKEQGPPIHADIALLRQKAYTLLIRAYGEVRDAVAYVRRKERDVDNIAPSLFASRGNRYGASADNTTDTETEVDDVETTVHAADQLNAAVANALAASHANGTAVPAHAVTNPVQPVIPVGFPGAPPLGKQ